MLVSGKPRREHNEDQACGDGSASSDMDILRRAFVDVSLYVHAIRYTIAIPGGVGSDERIGNDLVRSAIGDNVSSASGTG